ncbi:MAG: nucleotidyltransferase family protein [Chloroflexi bacterium]|nr:nucleotidyltransferase family protein [Chloroflexota bacterium]
MASQKPTKAVVLAAGEGTRLRPLTLDQPKPMLPIAGHPLLEHTLALLRQHGIADVAVNLHHRPEVITEYFSGVSEPHIVYSYEDHLLGTAGAAKKLSHFLDTTFVLVYGDMLIDIDLSDLLAYHRSLSAALTIAVYPEVEDPARCGIVEVDATGRALSFVEKPPKPKSNLANGGIYAIEPEVLREISDGSADFGRDVFPALIARGIPVYVWRIPSYAYYLDIGSFERYEQACRDACEGRIRILQLDHTKSVSRREAPRC